MVFILIYRIPTRFVLLEIIPLFCIVFEKAVREILFLTVFFQNLADLWRKYPFYLYLQYVPSSSNPADFVTCHC